MRTFRIEVSPLTPILLYLKSNSCNIVLFRKPSTTLATPSSPNRLLSKIKVFKQLLSLGEVEEAGVEHDGAEVQLLAILLHRLRRELDSEFCFMQQCLCHKGSKIFGDKGEDASVKELRQQHARKCFSPIAVEAPS